MEAGKPKIGFIPQWMVNLAIMLIVGAYGFIFTGILDQINENKDDIKECYAKIEELNPVFLQIQSDLSEIKTNVNWLMKNNEK